MRISRRFRKNVNEGQSIHQYFNRVKVVLKENNIYLNHLARNEALLIDKRHMLPLIPDRRVLWCAVFFFFFFHSSHSSHS
jgi:hypothetical protein